MLRGRLWLALTLAAMALDARAIVTSTTDSTACGCNGTQITCTVPFPFLDASNLVVTSSIGSGLPLTYGTHYTVSGAGSPTGAVRLTSTGAALCQPGQTLTVKRNVPMTQPLALSTQGPYQPKTIEKALDRSAMQAQQLKAKTDELQTQVTAEVTARVAGDTSLANRLAVLENGGGGSGGDPTVFPPGQPGPATYSDADAGGTVTVTWSAPTPAAASYTLEQADASTGPWVEVATSITATTYPVTGLVAGSTYWFRIKGTNLAGTGDYSSATSVTIPRTPVPGAPTYSNITARTVLVSWTAAAGVIVSYELQHADDAPGGNYTWATVATVYSGTSSSQGGLAEASKHWYRVRATTAAGPGAWSTPTSVTTLHLPLISQFTPSPANAGDTVTISGAYLTPTTAVFFGDKQSATVTEVSQAQITAVIPADATTAPITVVAAGGQVTTATDQVITSPVTCTIVSVSASDKTVEVGKSVLLTGTAYESPPGCNINLGVTWSMEPGYETGFGTLTNGGSGTTYNAPSAMPPGNIAKVRATRGALFATATITLTSPGRITGIYFDDPPTMAVNTTINITAASVTADPGTNDQIVVSVDDDAASTFPKQGVTTRPACSTGGATCGSVTNAACAWVGADYKCSLKYTSPGSAGAFRIRVTSKADPTTGDWFNATVEGGTIALAISPKTTSVIAAGSVTFTAGNTGTGPYTWSVPVKNSGAATITTGGVYTAGGTAGVTDTVRVTDSLAATADAQVTVNPPLIVQPGAFPGCQGSGCQTRGGFASGSRTILVTNLEPSGAGSLAACVAATGPRVCLFTVAGNIEAALNVNNPNITIDATSAPPGGIQLFNNTASCSGAAPFTINTSDVVIRGLKIRPTLDPGPKCGSCTGVSTADCSNKRAIRLYNDVGTPTRLVFDHNSIQYANASPIDLWVQDYSRAAASEMTFSWNIIGHSYWITGESNMSRAMIWGVSPSARSAHSSEMQNVDLHHNLIATTGYRNPEFKGASGRLVNNYLYNWGRHGFDLVGEMKVDVYGNTFKTGPLTNNNASRVIELNRDGNSTDNDWAIGQCSGSCYYVAENVDDLTGLTAGVDNWSSSYLTGAGFSSTYKRTSRLQTSQTGNPMTYDSAAVSRAAILGTAGAGASYRINCGGEIVAARDTLDTSIIGYEATNGGPSAAPTTNQALPGISPVTKVCAATTKDNSASGPEGACVCKDSDSDGIPDFYEHHFSTTDTGLDASRSELLTPFSNLEAYLSGLRPATTYSAALFPLTFPVRFAAAP